MNDIYSLPTKPSAGHDGISVKLLKYFCPVLSKPICLIINHGYLYQQTEDNKSNPTIQEMCYNDDNHCPMLLLTSMSKPLEKVVANHISGYLIND